MTKEILEGYEFEEKYGTLEFIKVCLSSLNNLLVKKGLITEEELQNSFLKEIKGGEKDGQ